MRKRSTSEVKRRTGADLRAQRDQRLGRPYELQEAGRREASFLKNITGAQDDLEWILTTRAWTQLGFERVADWWDARIGPVLDGLDLKPSAAMVERVVRAIVADEADLAKAQRRTQREIASIARTNQSKVARLAAESGGSASDLESNSGDVDSPPIDVPGSTAADGVSSISTSADGATPDRSVAPAGDGLARNEPVPGNPQDSPDAVDASIGLELADTRPGPDSSLAGDGASSSVDAERPPAPAAGDEAAEASTPPPPPKAFTEGQALATPSKGPVLPSASAGVSEAGGVVAGPVPPGPGLSSTDPASDWMTSWRGLIRSASAVSEYLTEDELAEVSDDMATLAKVLFEDTP